MNDLDLANNARLSKLLGEYIFWGKRLLYNSLLVIKLKIEDPSNIVQELHQQLLISQIKDFRISDIYGEFLVVKFRNGEIELLRDVQMG